MGALEHPGRFVRENVIPAGMSVAKAAERLGVGRPALSNFLNGKAALSVDMAERLEKAFGANSKELLDIQRSYERSQRSAGDRSLTLRAFVPSFLAIKAAQLEEWADRQLSARELLPVLLRKLVHSTGSGIERIDFPGYDNAQRKGPDGVVEANAGTPWVPAGKSHWEFGTNKKPGAKADKDYSARLATVDRDERAASTFVFVTPRNWADKTRWEHEKRAEGEWRDVRVLDASDLEQWLEQSVPAQVWLAESMGLLDGGFETLEAAWIRWSTATYPNLTEALFAPSIGPSREKLRNWLDRPAERAFVVAADSRDEALAFLACLFSAPELSLRKDLCAVFTAPAPLRKLVASSVPFIPIVYSHEVERELGAQFRRLHCIVFRPRNATDQEADIAVEPLRSESFRSALIGMGFVSEDVERLALESGRSPTILRRRLTQNHAIRTPAWALDGDMAKLLVPLTLVGAWHEASRADRAILSQVAGQSYEEIERSVTRLHAFDDPPVWMAGNYRGVVAKIDALFAVAGWVTSTDLERLLTAAEYVLAESDPALDLAEKDRWAAALYHKTRDHSAAIRTAICETLVILSVNGSGLFQDRLGIDLADRIGGLIRRLLTPLTSDKLLSHQRDLPMYAEAAPHELLSIIENDLRQAEPALSHLLRTSDGGLLASPNRSGLLWALEALAWSPQNLARVSRILSKLSTQPIDDNWVNKPEGSLQAIYRSWMPQTAASVEQRLMVLRLLQPEYPDVVWRICTAQFFRGSQVGFHSHRPRWRSDASTAGAPAIRSEIREVMRGCLSLMLGWSCHTEATLGDLVERSDDVPDEDRDRIWNIIDEWSKSASEAAQATIRERIRRFALTQRGRRRNSGGGPNHDRALEAYNRLRPSDVVERNAWLFADNWVEESASEIEEASLDFAKRDERIDSMRRRAIAQVEAQRGGEGLMEMARRSRAPEMVGRYAATCVVDLELRVQFVARCLGLEWTQSPYAAPCLRGFLAVALNDSGFGFVEAAMDATTPAETRARLVLCLPFAEPTWRFLDQHETLRDGYWKHVIPTWMSHTPAATSELVERLLEARRPRAAFAAVHLRFEDVETSQLKRLLYEVASVDGEPPDHFRLDRHSISDALRKLSGRPGVTHEQLAALEYMYIDLLDERHGLPNLERLISESPGEFAHLVALAYKRAGDGDDPQEWETVSAEKRTLLARAAHTVLYRLGRIPGSDMAGKVEEVSLVEWIEEARRLCRQYAREEMGDHCLGELLAKSPPGEHGRWPCEPVCAAMETVGTESFSQGFQAAVYNSRGIHESGEGGHQERDLATKYRGWAEIVQFEYPFVASVLTGLAKTYDGEAVREDNRARVSKRLRE